MRFSLKVSNTVPFHTVIVFFFQNRELVVDESCPILCLMACSHLLGWSSAFSSLFPRSMTVLALVWGIFNVQGGGGNSMWSSETWDHWFLLLIYFRDSSVSLSLQILQLVAWSCGRSRSEGIGGTWRCAASRGGDGPAATPACSRFPFPPTPPPIPSNSPYTPPHSPPPHAPPLTPHAHPRLEVSGPTPGLWRQLRPGETSTLGQSTFHLSFPLLPSSLLYP